MTLKDKSLAIGAESDGALSFTAMIRYLNDLKCTRQYLPERLEVIGEMPRTASGKIQKFALREMAKGFKPQQLAA